MENFDDVEMKGPLDLIQLNELKGGPGSGIRGHTTPKKKIESVLARAKFDIDRDVFQWMFAAAQHGEKTDSIREFGKEKWAEFLEKKPKLAKLDKASGGKITQFIHSEIHNEARDVISAAKEAQRVLKQTNRKWG